MTRKLSFFCFCMITCSLVSCPAWGQKVDTNLKTLKVSVQMESQPLGSIFAYLMQVYDLPIGFEQSTLDMSHDDYAFGVNLPAIGTKRIKSDDGKTGVTVGAQRRFKAQNHLITVKVKDEPLERVLDLIVAQMANYEWAMNDGVVNIFPARGRDGRFQKLLDTRVREFRLPSGQPVRAITDAIIRLPELQRFLRENNLFFTGFRPGLDILVKAQYDRPIETPIELSDLTFGELLNRTTKIKRGGWILRKKRSPNPAEEHIDIDV